MDTKIKADIAESAVVTELLKHGVDVLVPYGDRLPYDVMVRKYYADIEFSDTKIKQYLNRWDLIMGSSVSND